MAILRKVKQTVNQNYFLQYLYDRSKSIVNIIPFYLVREGIFDEIDLNLEPKIKVDQCETGFLGPSDMKAISASPEVNDTEEALLERIANGCLCLGIKYRSDIVAYMWCNLRECDSDNLSFKLEEYEAYLTDARTFNAYRGKNLAPYLRYQLYKNLREMGRTKLFSITEFFNAPAIRFKKKLKAKPLKFYLRIRFLKKYKWNILLRAYQP